MLNKFICGISGRIFEKLCEEDETLKLSEAYKKALVSESKITAKTIDSKSEVMFVKQRKSSSDTRSKGDKTKVPCTHCGWKTHQSSSCKFKESICNSCSKRGHLASICRNRAENKKAKPINFINSDSNDDSSSDFNFDFLIFTVRTADERVIHSVDSESRDKSRVYVLPITLAGVNLDITCETGAPLSLLSGRLFDRFYQRAKLRPCEIPFSGYGGNKIDVIGEFDATVIYKGQERSVTFIVTNTDAPPDG